MNAAHSVSELASLVPYLLERELKPGKVLTRVGIPTHALLDPDAWIPRNLFLALINASTAGDPHGGIHLGETESFEQYGALGKAILEAPTLRAALAWSAATLASSKPIKRFVYSRSARRLA